ncbi:amino acid ABC transporter ATP-binding/permease protein [Tropicimonas aquimaris]|uniref:Amino acid ABC transporter ATP-binding/permease protein n=1 Tax=Tropicimonas aquimaris TaxID=914152 RepID=A0ABW3IN35_9RHOB
MTRHLLSVFAVILRSESWALARGIALSVIVLAMGVTLLGLSGWFIVAAGAAGLAGTGAVFDVFRPSAAVRFLALGRTAARYGERLLTHDATLRALALLRVRLLARISATPFEAMSRYRGAQVLGRLTADVDALDGVALRLVIPLLAGSVTLAGAWAVLAWLVDPRVASWSVLGLAAGSALALGWAVRASARPSRLAAAADQAFRVRVIDHLRGRAMLAFAGQLDSSLASVLDADARARRAGLQVALVERRAGVLVSVAVTIAAAGALLLGSELARSEVITAPSVALGVLGVLALAETVAPLRRGAAEIGAMRDAARRVNRILQTTPDPRPVPAGPQPDIAPGLQLDTVTLASPGSRQPLIAGVNLSVAPGETVALTGPSGIGKSTLLNAVAGLSAVQGGRILIGGRPVGDWPEPDLRTVLGYLPQRSALISGTIAENLTLGAPDAGDAALHAVLSDVALDGVARRVGGLGARLGEGGKGLSGGEARRLQLARVLLRRPRILLLDEPTEGLDRETAIRVLQGVRRACPDAAILLSAHREVERDWANRALPLIRP